MLTKEEFYRLKIFYKESISFLRLKFDSQIKDINSWKGCNEYKDVQRRKSFIKNKLKQFAENEEIALDITPDLVYTFYQWWKDEPKHCNYCKLSESDLEKLRNIEGHINKRYPKRGKSLEIDRKNPHGSYTDTKNLVLACYWCNNAKTDTFTEEEFKQIANSIKLIWETRLGKSLM